MKIAIIFIGLIVQVNQPMSFDNTAVLLGAAEHEPKLVIPLQSIIDPDKWLQNQPKNGSDVEIDLQGATVRVKGTRGVFSDLKDAFTEGSPALRSLVPSCELRDEVRNRQIVPGKLAAYVDFRGGAVLPEAYLPKKLSFTGKKEDGRCTVCRVRYEADLRGDHVTLVYKKKFKKPDGTEDVERHEIHVAGGRPEEAGGVPHISVINRPPHAIARHFDLAFNIYVGKCGDSGNFRPLVTESDCTEPKVCEAIPYAGLADPGDDCTIVRDPP